jgi:hypothetical protein
MSTILLIYLALWLISFIWLTSTEKYVKQQTNDLYSDFVYTAFNFLSSFLLFGIVNLIHHIYTTIKRKINIFIVVVFAMYVLWKIKRKYKIK